jgi:hypothetical protein
MVTYKRLKTLNVNKTMTFDSPLYDDKNSLVRTGTIADGSCGIHSILHSYSDKYVEKTIDERRECIKKLRSVIANNLTKENWEKIDNGMVSYISFQENLNLILTTLYKNGDDCINDLIVKNINEDEKKYTEFFKFIIQLISIEDFEKHILPNSYKSIENDNSKMNLEKTRKKIINETVNWINNIIEKKLNKLDENRKLSLINATKIIIKNCIKHAKNIAFFNYQSNIENTTSFIDMTMISLLSDYFNRDIYFIDAKTRMPYPSNQTIKNRKSIIIIWIDDVHYEIVGELLDDNIIKRVFDPNDDLILKIKTFLYNPEDIEDRYPELIEFLPKNYKSKLYKSSPSANSKLKDLMDDN